MDRLPIERYVANRNLNFAKEYRKSFKESIENNDKILFWILASTLSALGFALNNSNEIIESFNGWGLLFFCAFGIIVIISIVIYKLAQLYKYDRIVTNEYAISEEVTADVTYYFNHVLVGNENKEIMQQYLLDDFDIDISKYSNYTSITAEQLRLIHQNLSKEYSNRYMKINDSLTKSVLKRYGVNFKLYDESNKDKIIQKSYDDFIFINPWLKVLPIIFYMSFILFIISGVLIYLHKPISILIVKFVSFF